MRARDAEGRRIVKVNQTRVWNVHVNQWDVVLDSIELDNGTVVHFMAVETEVEPMVTTVLARLTAPITA